MIMERVRAAAAVLMCPPDRSETREDYARQRI
jgi:hypothetical protein